MNTTPQIPVVFSSTDDFVPYMAALIQSIMDNAKLPARYRFFVLHQEISPSTQGLLKAQVAKGSATGEAVFFVDFIDVSAHIKGYRFHAHYLPVESYFRLLIPYLFEYEKMLYLDGDMICGADLADLYALDLGTKLLAACRDDFLAGERGRYHARSIGLADHRDYFNAGMLLFNMGPFQKIISQKAILDLAVSRDWQFCDQDVLNIIAKDRTLILNMEWNAMVTMHNEDQFPPELREEYRRSRERPKISHFAGPKPWNTRFGFGLSPANRKAQLELFLRYAERTPFIGIIKERLGQR